MQTPEKELKTLIELLEALQKQLQALQDQNQALRIENKLLHAKVQFLLKRMFGRKSEKIDPRQLQLLLQGLAVEETPPEDDPPRSPPSPPRAPREKNKPRMPADLPVEEEVIIPEAVEHNLQAYKCIGEEVTEELDVDPARYFKRRIIRRKYVRKDRAEQAPIIAPLKPRLIEGGYASVGLVTDIILKKYVDHLPLYRQERILKTRHGIDLSRKTMCDWVGKTADLLGAIYQHVRTGLKSSGYLQIDETPVRYCRDDDGGGGQGYLWAYHHPGEDVLFEWHTSRSADCLERMLGNFSGTAQSDGYSAYPAFAKGNSRIVLAGCWAHARRKFKDAVEETPGMAGWFLNQIGLLYGIEAGLRDRNVCARLRQVARSAASRMILARIQKALRQKMPAYLPKSRMGLAIGYALSRWEQLERYIDDGRIEIDNNLVENAIRPTALGKKNWLFFGAPDAGQRSAIIYTLLESCRRRGINQREYLLDVLTRLPAMKITEVAELTPARWQAARKAAQNQAA